MAKLCPQCGLHYDTAAAFCQRDGARLEAEAANSDDPFIGQTVLEQFKIEERIGAGAMGAVYRAHQSTLARDVAIKILHRDLASNPDAIRRFQREARVCTALDHPNVVRVFLFGQLGDGSLYIVMELLRGRSLLEVVEEDRALPVARALHIVTQICDGVGEAHAQGVVHRDLKPENILLVQKGRDADFAKVLDFGIARVLSGMDQTQATQSGLVFGTARYISPEGAAGEATDARSDVYSLGVLTYQLLAGETPFEAPTPVAMLMKHIHSAPAPLRARERARRVPVPVAEVVMRALAKNPDARFHDAHALGDALRNACGAAGIALPGPGARRGSTYPPPGELERTSAEAPRAEPPEVGGGWSEGSLMGRGSHDGVDPASPRRELSGPRGTILVGESAEDVSIPGLPRRAQTQRVRTAASVALAFGLGISLVVCAFALFGQEERGPRVPEPSLGERARQALQRGHYDEPREGSVLELTETMLRERPGDAEAGQLRRDAAASLGELAAEAAARGRTEEARALYRRAHTLNADDAELERRLAALGGPASVSSDGISVSPEPVVERSAVTFSVTLGEPGARSGVGRGQFLVFAGDQSLGGPLPARESADGHHFEATYTFAADGLYRVVFRHGEGARRLELSRDVVVSNRGPSRRSRSSPPPVTTQGSWSSPAAGSPWPPTPAVLSPQREPEPPPPPAPWSGQGSVL